MLTGIQIAGHICPGSTTFSYVWPYLGQFLGGEIKVDSVLETGIAAANSLVFCLPWVQTPSGVFLFC
jgi:hypothetical protein